MPRGRPEGSFSVELSPALVEAVLLRVHEGETLRAVARHLGFEESTWRMRCIKDKDFFAQYMRARIGQAESWADEIVALADTSRQGKKKKTNADGTEEVTTGDMVERSKLQIETRKWLLARLHPAVYAEKIKTEVSGPEGGPLVVMWQETASAT